MKNILIQEAVSYFFWVWLLSALIYSIVHWYCCICFNDTYGKYKVMNIFANFHKHKKWPTRDTGTTQGPGGSRKSRVRIPPPFIDKPITTIRTSVTDMLAFATKQKPASRVEKKQQISLMYYIYYSVPTIVNSTDKNKSDNPSFFSTASNLFRKCNIFTVIMRARTTDP